MSDIEILDDFILLIEKNRDMRIREIEANANKSIKMTKLAYDMGTIAAFKEGFDEGMRMIKEREEM
jgi:hypothetical protein